MRWSAYAVLDQDNKLLKAYVASDPWLAAVAGLPSHDSSAVPRELFAPVGARVRGGDAPPLRRVLDALRTLGTGLLPLFSGSDSGGDDRARVFDGVVD